MIKQQALTDGSGQRTEAGHFPSYSEYHDSSVEWIGRIPSSWDTTRVKYLADYINGYSFSSDQWERNGRKIVRIQNLTGTDSDYNRYSGQLPSRYLAEPGDLLISWSASLGIHRWNGDEKAWVNQHIYKVIPNRRIINEGFLYWLGTVFMDELEREMHGSAMQHVTRQKFESLEVPLPPKEQQQTIAVFIRRKAAKIDELIDRKQKLLELLEEKRRALITQRVTGGLDEEVPTQQSDLEWYGEVPAHWDLLELKYCADDVQIGPFGSSLKLEDMSDSGEYKVYGQKNVIEDDFEAGEKWVDQDKFDELSGYEVAAGDVLVTMAGTTGMCAEAPEGVEQGVMDSHLLRVRVDSAILNPTFLAYLINDSVPIRSQMRARGRGATMHGLNTSIIESLVLPVPPMKEQVAICSSLKDKVSRNDSLQMAVKEGEALLEELRAALIRNAVTGKIDVESLSW